MRRTMNCVMLHIGVSTLKTARPPVFRKWRFMGLGRAWMVAIVLGVVGSPTTQGQDWQLVWSD
ncbi:MAG: hypothetical protein O2899_08445, partial [Bacteroidetes bacterium]|nr:hypothetical protein [Bacteroidota bacterium]